MSDPFDMGVGFKTVPERLEGERAERIDRGQRVLRFGVSFLDEALGGIFPNDLVVLGAKTGVGKTALSTIIAHESVKAGKRVHYFALEAEEREIERRIKYREISDLVYRSSASHEIRKRMNYVDWYSGKLDGITGELIEKRVDEIISERFKTLHTYYRLGAFGLDEISRLFMAVQDETDLIILDHLHYVDVEDTDENRGVKDIVKRIRDISLVLGKPIIVVAHLRKSDRRQQFIVPDLDDFHGTSDITKIATKCIMLAPARDQEAEQPHLWPTYMYAPKCRMDGSRTRFIGMLVFNARMQTYESNYLLGRANLLATEFEELKRDEHPTWATSAG